MTSRCNAKRATIGTLKEGQPVTRAFEQTYSYLISDEGTVGAATVSVLILASVVMVKCLMAYPWLITVVAFEG
jgi:hypothetical protein